MNNNSMSPNPLSEKTGKDHLSGGAGHPAQKIEHGGQAPLEEGNWLRGETLSAIALTMFSWEVK